MLIAVPFGLRSDINSLAKKDITMSYGRTSLPIALACGWLALSFAAQAQPKVARLGILASASGPPSLRATFQQSLQALGYVEGQNLAVELLQAEGRLELLPAFAEELVRREVDVIVALGPSAVRAAQRASRTIPIVMLINGDPIGAGLVPNLSRPGGNVTGMTTLSSRLSARRLAFLREVVPQVNQVAVLFNPNDEAKMVDWQQIQAAARAMGVRVQAVEMRAPTDLASGFTAIGRGRPGGLLALSDSLTFQHRTEIARWAVESRLPAMYEFREYVEAGGLMAYGPRLPDMFQRLAGYVDRILRGAHPGELAVEAPTTFELVVNLKAAQAIGLALPPAILSQATEVVP
jgi:putative ABC transport system substrate-binding protein